MNQYTKKRATDTDIPLPYYDVYNGHVCSILDPQTSPHTTMRPPKQEWQWMVLQPLTLQSPYIIT